MFTPELFKMKDLDDGVIVDITVKFTLIPRLMHEVVVMECCRCVGKTRFFRRPIYETLVDKDIRVGMHGAIDDCIRVRMPVSYEDIYLKVQADFGNPAYVKVR